MFSSSICQRTALGLSKVRDISSSSGRDEKDGGKLTHVVTPARVSVHFNSLCDHFSPYDTAFSITNPKELKDTKLSAACSLHAASGSTSSSTSSLRRRRLMEIAEEEEEEQRERKRQSTVNEEERPTSSQGGDNNTPASVLSPASPPAVTLNSDLATSPEESQFAGTLDPPTFIGIPRPPSPSKSFDDAGRRSSSQSARPDLYSYSSYTYGKPRVKLGPRPSLETGGRPRTSAGTGTYRPVSSIPAGFKLSSKGSKRSQSQDKISESEESEVIKEEATETTESAESVLPTASSLHPESHPAGYERELTRPHTSSGTVPTKLISSEASLKSNLPIMAPPPAKQNFMTPEKARLMKAMKLREKRKILSAQPIATSHNAAAPSEPPTPSLPTDAQYETEHGKALAVGEESAVKNDEADGRLYTSNTDSAIAIDVANDQSSIDTRCDSHPTSPIGASSDIGDSTKASSLSESTDETVQPDSTRKEDEGDDDEDEEEDVKQAEIATEENEDRHLPAKVEAQGPEELSTPEEVEVTGETEAPKDAVESQQPVIIDEELTREATSTTAVEVPSYGENTEECTALPISRFSAASPTGRNESQSEDLPDIAASGDNARALEDTPSAAYATPDSPQWKVPLSKFSTQGAQLPPTTPTKSPIPFIVTPSPHPDDEAPSHDGVPVNEPDSARASSETRRSKRKAAIEPIRTDLDIPDKDKSLTESDLSDDDELMEELQSATLQQAKHITVSKSPITPVSPVMSPKRSQTGLDGGLDRNPHASRAVSNPIRHTLAPGDLPPSSGRTVSSGAAFLHKITQQSSSADLRPKSSKIGSSISQRIKALEKLSANAGGAPDVVAPKERPSSSFFSVRKTSPREPAKSPSVLERASAALRGTTPSPPDSRESSPETDRNRLRDRSGSMASRLSMFETGNTPRGRPDSIQVKARIIRDPNQPFPKMPELKADTDAYSPLDLKQSPLVVDLQKASPSPISSPYKAPTPAPAPAESDAEAPPERRLSLLQRRWSKGRRSQSEDRDGQSGQDEAKHEPSNRPRRRSSLTVVKDFIKDRRDSLLPSRSESTDNLNLGLSVAPQLGGNLMSPGITTPSRSPSRPPSVHQTSMFPRRLSISSRRSSIEVKSPALQTAPLSTGGLSPSLMTEASGESDGDDRLGNGYTDKRSPPGSNGSLGTPSPGPKNPNRATRFMRRLSNSLGSSRKGVTPSISPTVEEEGPETAAAYIPSRANTSSGIPQPSISSYMGDVNVQFPDTLLWKRRTMCLDSQGFLILSTVQGVSAAREKQAAGAVKRYHLSDFRAPYIPEMEVQELPNSVVLDFVDGSGLQIACEDRAGQLNTLHGEF